MFSISFWTWSFLILSLIVVFIGVLSSDVQDDSPIRKMSLLVVSVAMVFILLCFLPVGLAFLIALKEHSFWAWLFVALFLNSATIGITVFSSKIENTNNSSPYITYVFALFAIALFFGGC